MSELVHRQAIKESQESARKLAKTYQVSHVTTAKWKKAKHTEDKSHRPKTIHYAVPREFWRIIKKAREGTKLPLDDLLFQMVNYEYFLYIRKSTDEDDRQILSLEAQETELLEFAEKEKLVVVDAFRESQTAKEPGRPIFNKILERIEKGEVDGILAWHPDRLARNSVDGGKIFF